MNSIWVIAKREFRSYFNSPIAYVAITVFLVMVGVLFFWVDDFFQGNEATLRPFFEWVPLIFVFYLPAVSMRLLSEEKRSGTMELLITMPVRDVEIVLGKYLAALLFLLATLWLSLIYPLVVGLLAQGGLPAEGATLRLILWVAAPLVGAVAGLLLQRRTRSALGWLWFGAGWMGIPFSVVFAFSAAPDAGPVIGGYLGLLLVGGAYLAIGLMTSTFTRNQIISFILSLGICGFFYFVDRLVKLVWEGARGLFDFLSFSSHFQNISRGVVDSRDVIFYLSLIVVCVMVSSYALASRKWR